MDSISGKRARVTWNLNNLCSDLIDSPHHESPLPWARGEMGWDGPPMRRNSTGKRHKFRAARIVLKREFLIRPFLKSIDTLDRCYVIACCVVKFSSSPFIHSFIIYPDIDDSFRIERRKKKIRNSKSLVQSARIPPTILIYLSACCPRNRNSDSKFRATENRRLLGRLDEDRDHRLSLFLSLEAA